MVETFYLVERSHFLQDADYTKIHEPLLSARDSARNWAGPWKLISTSIILQGFEVCLYSTWSRQYRLSE